MRIPLWSKLRLAPRIAILMVATAVAVQAFDSFLQYILPPPGYLIIDQTWLARAAGEARQIAEAAPPTDRRAALASSGLMKYLGFAIVSQAPDYRQDDPPRVAREVKAALLQATGLGPEDVLVMTEDFEEHAVKTNVAVVSTLPIYMDTEALVSRDSIVMGDIRIAIRLKDGAWLTIGPSNEGLTSLHHLRNILGLAGTLFFVAAFSIWMARSIVTPLTNLAQAAEKLGRERETTPITGMKLPELASIADTFNEMQARLKKFVDERMQMLAAISHDLRTPLTRLRLYAETVPN
ncbi:MAG: HAMP domain-containing protein, partial [Solimonas sp.]